MRRDVWDVIGYGGSTTCRPNIERLRAAGFGVVVTPRRPQQPELRYMLDNGAFYLWQEGKPFDERKFLDLLNKVRGFANKPDFGVCPDKVAAGWDSLEYSMAWRDRLPADWPWYLAVQDGMTPCGVLQVVDRFAGLFVGGTSEWKLRSLPGWVHLARQERKQIHVGRVNSLSRAFYVTKVCGADSFDGTSWQRTWTPGRPDKHPGRVAGDVQMPLDLWAVQDTRRKGGLA